MNISKLFFSAAIFLAATIANSWLPAFAEDATFVVLDSTGSSFHTGDKLTATQTISLSEGQTLTLVGTDGSVMMLKGPFNGEAKGASQEKTASVSDMLTPLLQKASTENATPGVIRGSAVAGPRTDAWVIDTTQSGDVCVHNAVDYDFWRPDPQGTEDLSIVGADGSTTKVSFGAGQARVKVPDSLTFKDNANYKMSGAKGTETIIVHTIPESVAPQSKMAAAWFASKKCTAQAQALLRSLSGQ